MKVTWCDAISMATKETLFGLSLQKIFVKVTTTNLHEKPLNIELDSLPLLWVYCTMYTHVEKKKIFVSSWAHATKKHLIDGVLEVNLWIFSVSCKKSHNRGKLPSKHVGDRISPLE